MKGIRLSIRKQRIGRMRKSMLIVLISAGMLAGCGSSAESSQTMDYSADNAGIRMTDDIYMEEAAQESGPAPESAPVEGRAENTGMIADNRKLIKNVTMNVETEEYDKLLGTVENRVTEMGGYVESLNSNANESSDYWNMRYAEIKARIPVDKLDSFVSFVDEMSNVTSRQVNVDDVTMQYVDLVSHKKMLQIEQESLLRLLEKAETLEDIFTIESRLSEVRYEIETMETQLRTYDNLVTYSTVQIYISEVERITPVVEKGAWERIKTGYGENVYRIGNSLKEFAIEVAIALPFIFLLAGLSLVVFLTVRIVLKITGKRKEKTAFKKTENIPYKEYSEQHQNTDGQQVQDHDESRQPEQSGNGRQDQPK